MAGESLEALLRSLTGSTGDSATEVYLKWASLAATGDDTLESSVRRKLVAGGHTANIRENLLSTLKAGGATGESVEECLLKSSLTGWS
jgi:hypothetical protein